MSGRKKVSVRQEMLKEAKRIASINFKPVSIVDRNMVVGWISIDSQRDKEIVITLNEFQEFNSGEFRKMIMDLLIKNSEAQNDFLSN